MSIIHEIHNQRPAVRHAFFIFAVVIALSVVGIFTYSSLQRDMFMAFHTDPKEQSDFLAAQQEKGPQPLALISRVASSLTASIGSLVGWNRSAGFDRGSQQDTMQGGVHLFPLSK